MAFRVSTLPAAWKHNLATSNASDRVALHSALRVIRARAFDEDVYFSFGDNTVTATLEQGLCLPAGQTELFEPPVGTTYMAFITANAAKMNVCYGENE